jgi:hypothetical protein
MEIHEALEDIGIAFQQLEFTITFTGIILET